MPSPSCCLWLSRWQPARKRQPAWVPQFPYLPRPFALELLDLKRGEWHFVDVFGQRLELKDPVSAWAYPGTSLNGIDLKFLCCDPEFPEDRGHAVLKTASVPLPSAGDGRRFRIDEPYFSANIEVRSPVGGTSPCLLTDIRFGPAEPGDRYVAGLYLAGGGHSYPLWLSQGADGAPAVRMVTDRIGNVFVGAEQVVITLTRLGAQSNHRGVALEGARLRAWRRGLAGSQTRCPTGRPGLLHGASPSPGTVSSR